VGMAAVLQKRIEATTLLPHVPQAKVGAAFVHVIANANDAAANAVVDQQLIHSGLYHACQIDTVAMLERTVGAKVFCRGLARLQHGFACMQCNELVLLQFEEGILTAQYHYFAAAGSIAQLIIPDNGLRSCVANE